MVAGGPLLPLIGAAAMLMLTLPAAMPAWLAARSGPFGRRAGVGRHGRRLPSPPTASAPSATASPGGRSPDPTSPRSPRCAAAVPRPQRLITLALRGARRAELTSQIDGYGEACAALARDAREQGIPLLDQTGAGAAGGEVAAL
jgi:hypothetical protein